MVKKDLSFPFKEMEHILKALSTITGHIFYTLHTELLMFDVLLYTEGLFIKKFKASIQKGIGT